MNRLNKNLKDGGVNWAVSYKAIVLLFLFNFASFGFAKGQHSAYDQAISKFTGTRKYDIEKPGALDGVSVPDFDGTTIKGKKVSLKELRGKVVVLNFWFIACPPCRIEVPPLNEVVRQFRKQKEVVFLSVAREKKADLKEHLRSNEFLFQTVADPKSEVSNKIFHLFGYPTTIVVDREGKIRYYTLGGKITEESVRKELKDKLIPVIEKYLAVENRKD